MSEFVTPSGFSLYSPRGKAIENNAGKSKTEKVNMQIHSGMILKTFKICIFNIKIRFSAERHRLRTVLRNRR